MLKGNVCQPSWMLKGPIGAKSKQFQSQSKANLINTIHIYKNLFVRGFMLYLQYFRRQFTNLSFLDHFLPVLNQSIILTLAGQSMCYSHNPEIQRGKPLLSVLKTLVCRGPGSNQRPSVHKADALTTRPPRGSMNIYNKSDKIHILQYLNSQTRIKVVYFHSSFNVNDFATTRLGL